jgi:hypothetical protein
MTRLALLLCAFVTAGAVAACGETQPQSETARLDRQVVAALCEVRDQALHDADMAKEIFLDRAHDWLHDLAREVAGIDRSAAARLLEAKQAVEADLERPSSSALAKDLKALVASTRRALEVTNGSAPSCPQGGDDG